MKPLIWSVCTLMVLGGGVGTVGAAESMMDNEVTPTLGERLKDTVEGTLLKIDGESYWVKDIDGKEVKLHVDASTRRDKVMIGDKVKAYVEDSGHITTLQHDE